MPVLRNIKTLYSCQDSGTQNDLHEVHNAAMVWQKGKIIWVGKEDDLPTKFHEEDDHFDAKQKIVTPGLIDCHTHLVFGGWREKEFVKRVQGLDYTQIMKEGGGILSTVTKTRAATFENLVEKTMYHLHDMALLGVTTVEIKSGYGLSLGSELKILKVCRKLKELQPVEIVPTLLAAHVVPPEYKDRPSEYVDLITDTIVPKVVEEKLAECCDVFVEEGAFSAGDAHKIFKAAKEGGLKLKMHVDQFADGGGAALASDLKTLSADHLEYMNPSSIGKFKQAGTVAVAVPLSALNTFSKNLDARKLVDQQIPVAVASDFNPGSSPSYHLPFVMHLSCRLNRLTPKEVLKGTTLMAAKALGKEGQIGSLEKGKQADFILLDSPSADHWLYHFQSSSCVSTIKKGQVVFGSLQRFK